MKVVFLGLTIVVLLTGCSWLNKVAPSQTDEQGNILVGTHELEPFSKDVAGAIPYGGVVTSGLLLVWNFIERAKANKTTAGLMATIRAIEVASQDPATKEAIEKLKVQLAEAHQSVDVQPLVNRLLSKIKFGV